MNLKDLIPKWKFKVVQNLQIKLRKFIFSDFYLTRNDRIPLTNCLEYKIPFNFFLNDKTNIKFNPTTQFNVYTNRIRRISVCVFDINSTVFII